MVNRRKAEAQEEEPLETGLLIPVTVPTTVVETKPIPDPHHRPRHPVNLQPHPVHPLQSTEDSDSEEMDSTVQADMVEPEVEDGMAEAEHIPTDPVMMTVGEQEAQVMSIHLPLRRIILLAVCWIPRCTSPVQVLHWVHPRLQDPQVHPRQAILETAIVVSRWSRSRRQDSL